MHSLPLLDSEVLKNYVAIVDAGSMSAAAKVVHRTPSALSMQIKQLESTLGKQLLIRESRQVRPTREGELLLDYARRLLQLNEEAVQHFVAPTLEGRVGIGTSDDVGTRVLPEILSRFARTHPAVQVDVFVGPSRQNLGKLDARSLDMVLVTVAEDSRKTPGEVVHHERLVWAGVEGGSAAQRRPLPLAVAHHGCTWRGMSLRALEEANIPFRIAYTCEHCSGQEAALLADLAVAPMPEKLVKPPLVEIAEEVLPAIGIYQLALVRRRRTPITNALAEYVQDAFQSFGQS